MIKHSRCVHISVPFYPEDRAALARAAHMYDMSPAQFLEWMAVEWLTENNFRTIAISLPTTVDVEKQPKVKRKSVKGAKNSNQHELTL